MGKKNIKLRVKNLVKKYNTTSPYKICDKLKIDIIYADLDDIKGFYTKILSNKYIILNYNLDEISQRIILCHELGHAVLHGSKSINFMKKKHLILYKSGRKRSE